MARSFVAHNEKAEYWETDDKHGREPLREREKQEPRS